MTRKRRHPAHNVTHQLLFTYRWTFIVYWIVFIAIFIGIAVVLNHLAPSKEAMDSQSVWEGAANSPKVFLMVIGILLTPLSLASFVSSGVTRKHFIMGIGFFMMVMSAIFAFVMVAGYPIEQMIYDKNGWSLALNNPHIFTSSDQLIGIFFEYFFLFFAYFGSGWMIGSGFTRFQWQIGIIISVVALLPAMAMEVVLSSDWMGSLMQSVFEVERSPLAAVIVLAIIVMASIIGLNYLLIRRVAIKKKVV
ncbi:hypothetical protein [Paenibacillus sinopodophylli]|uniref:hypothetical protein n=1 Tax=Paenibacillus sinopodophylli TaxID=1837342 RepID=UPI00110CED73|nr:hypothetical protein [Paenibacillus sinopodophylli]